MLCVKTALGKNYSNWINAFGKGVTCHVVMVVTAIKMHQATLSIAALKLKRIYRHELAASWIGFHFLKGDITFLMKNEHWNDASSRRSWKVWKNGEKSCILAHVLQCLLYHHYSADQLTFGVLYGLQSLKKKIFCAIHYKKTVPPPDQEKVKWTVLKRQLRNQDTHILFNQEKKCQLPNVTCVTVFENYYKKSHFTRF